MQTISRTKRRSTKSTRDAFLCRLLTGTRHDAGSWPARNRASERVTPTQSVNAYTLLGKRVCQRFFFTVCGLSARVVLFLNYISRIMLTNSHVDFDVAYNQLRKYQNRKSNIFLNFLITMLPHMLFQPLGPNQAIWIMAWNCSYHFRAPLCCEKIFISKHMEEIAIQYCTFTKMIEYMYSVRSIFQYNIYPNENLYKHKQILEWICSA